MLIYKHVMRTNIELISNILTDLSICSNKTELRTKCC